MATTDWIAHFLRIATCFFIVWLTQNWLCAQFLKILDNFPVLTPCSVMDISLFHSFVQIILTSCFTHIAIVVTISWNTENWHIRWYPTIPCYHHPMCPGLCHHITEAKKCFNFRYNYSQLKANGTRTYSEIISNKHDFHIQRGGKCMGLGSMKKESNLS